MSKYREQRERLNERVAMVSKLSDQFNRSKPDSLENLLLVRILKEFTQANGLMHQELEKLRESGEDKTIYPESSDLNGGNT
ncbi:hypothetical protein [Marinobacter arenosus]|uniref:hypothetical protein n=1 Tax=Marinobacter arenosus TaxID=2856822 RepID=UPI001C4D307A|nr:hypothetical protein [Marinobacter arenosus]MBW0149565.1 hypothetical protein [Marinobacter arenosus]